MRSPGAFGRWMAAACDSTGLTPIAVDGKSARAAKRNTATGCLTVVSAWATENRLTLGQVAVPDGSNEVAAIPELLRTLDLAGAIVTIAAAGCQAANAEIIRGQGGHYLLAVKDNQPKLRAAVERVVEAACEAGLVGMDGGEEVDDAHGRHEERYVGVFPKPEGIPADWPDVAAVQVNRERVVGGVRTSTSHYYLTSLRAGAEVLAGYIRNHWGIEKPQPDCRRSDSLCDAGGTGYHRTRGSSGVGRMVRPATRPRRQLMPDTVLAPPRR